MATMLTSSVAFRRLTSVRLKTSGRIASSPRRISAQAGSHAAFFQEVTGGKAPEKLSAMIDVLKAQGHSIVNPTTQANLHPYLVPISEGSPILPSMTEPQDVSRTGESDVFVCLLMWPNTGEHEGMELPVVSMSAAAPGVRLLARSVDEYLHRVLATEDVLGGEQPLAAAAGDMGRVLYELLVVAMQPGTVAKFNLSSKLEAYLATKAGMYCDVAEKLVFNHLEKDDQMSSLITGEWYMRKHFNGWARPFEFVAQHQLRCGHTEEARDTARMALRMPWWSLQQGYSGTSELAQIPGSPREVFMALNDEAGVDGPVQQSVAAGRSDAEAAVMEADLLMNLVAAGESGDWDAIRSDVASLNERAGNTRVAQMMKAMIV